MELFAYKVQLTPDGDLTSSGTTPISNFDNFYDAFVTVFIVLTGENWNNIYQTYARDNFASSTIFFYSLIVFGQLILLNLFLAILLDNFDEVEEQDRMKKIHVKAKEHKAILGKALLFKAL